MSYKEVLNKGGFIENKYEKGGAVSDVVNTINKYEKGGIINNVINTTKSFGNINKYEKGGLINSIKNNIYSP